jgi:hypothetical protein
MVTIQNKVILKEKPEVKFTMLAQGTPSFYL